MNASKISEKLVNNSSTSSILGGSSNARLKLKFKTSANQTLKETQLKHINTSPSGMLGKPKVNQSAALKKGLIKGGQNFHRMVSNVNSQPVSLITSARDGKMATLVNKTEIKASKISVNEYTDLQTGSS